MKWQGDSDLSELARLRINLNRPAMLLDDDVVTDGEAKSSALASALHLTGLFKLPLETLAIIFVLMSFASIISLGSGFRGGLFFASLLLGALGGQLFATGVSTVFPMANLDPDAYAIVGLSALAASVIGGPLTMSFIALESTGDLWLTTAVLIAVIISRQVTREFFGYTFATWRFHLRGETIRSAADVGWIRDLSVRQMMRADVRTTPAETPLSVFRRQWDQRLPPAVPCIRPPSRVP
jgi:CIC family chloride channel protein